MAFPLEIRCTARRAHSITRFLAESIIDKAIELHAIGGVHDRQIPTSFICLTLKLLQLQPEKEILFEYLLAEEFKYVLLDVVDLPDI